jgi:hypothetical protein
VAVIVSVWLPGASFLALEIRPWKRIRLVPGWPSKCVVPAGSVWVQVGSRRLRLFWATHFRPTRRPASVRVKTKLRAAVWSSVKLKVVPTGGLREMVSFKVLPSRHRALVWASLVKLGALPAGDEGGGAEVEVDVTVVEVVVAVVEVVVTGGEGVVNVMSLLVLVPSGLVAVSWAW